MKRKQSAIHVHLVTKSHLLNLEGLVDPNKLCECGLYLA